MALLARDFLRIVPHHRRRSCLQLIWGSQQRKNRLRSDSKGV